MNFLKNKGFVSAVFLILVSIVSVIFFNDIRIEFSSESRWLWAILLSLTPGICWLFFFYRQDKYDKEPIIALSGVFLLGLIVFLIITIPLQSLFKESFGNTSNSFVKIAFAAFVLVGFLQQLMKYLVVRFTVFNAKVFNEPADGVVYMIATGIGVAAAYNFMYIYSLEELTPGTVIARVVNSYLLSATFAGIAGYYMGKAKFKTLTFFRREIYMLAGVVLAALLQTVCILAGILIQYQHWASWLELSFNGALSVGVFSLMYFFLYKSVESSQFKKMK